MNRDVRKPLMSIFLVLCSFELIVLFGVGCDYESGVETRLRVSLIPKRVISSLLWLYQFFNSIINSKKLQTGKMDISGFRTPRFNCKMYIWSMSDIFFDNLTVKWAMHSSRAEEIYARNGGFRRQSDLRQGRMTAWEKVALFMSSSPGALEPRVPPVSEPIDQVLPFI